MDLGEKPSQQPSASFSTSDELQSVHDPSAIGQESDKDITAADENGKALEHMQSRHAGVNDTSEIPNGGLWAWLQVLGAFFLTFNSW